MNFIVLLVGEKSNVWVTLREKFVIFHLNGGRRRPTGEHLSRRAMKLLLLLLKTQRYSDLLGHYLGKLFLDFQKKCEEL